MNVLKKLKGLVIGTAKADVQEWRDPQAEENPMPCPEITIDRIDADLYARLMSEATAAGATFDGVNAHISGLDFDWNYDSAAQILHVTCVKKPFYASCSEVESRIRESIEKAKGSI